MSHKQIARCDVPSIKFEQKQKNTLKGFFEFSEIFYQNKKNLLKTNNNLFFCINKKKKKRFEIKKI